MLPRPGQDEPLPERLTDLSGRQPGPRERWGKVPGKLRRLKWVPSEMAGRDPE